MFSGGVLNKPKDAWQGLSLDFLARDLLDIVGIHP